MSTSEDPFIFLILSKKSLLLISISNICSIVGLSKVEVDSQSMIVGLSKIGVVFHTICLVKIQK